MGNKISFMLGLFLIGGLLMGCRPATLSSLPDVAIEPAPYTTKIPTTEFVEAAAPQKNDPSPIVVTHRAALPTDPATLVFSLPSVTATLLPTPTVTQTPLPTPIGPCSLRMPADDLLAVVTLKYGLNRDYAPKELIPLADALPMSVTMGYPSEIRRVAFEPLVQMVGDMQEEGLRPQILSAYRSYAAQAIAWNKWNDLYPERAAIISAPPGYSEHQLGTVVDFGSPELASIVGQEDIEFHTYFYKTSEGAWLAENAHNYGFTLSFTAEASDISGFYYEPWHYRYVGVETARFLREKGLTLTEHKLAALPEPCIP